MSLRRSSIAFSLWFTVASLFAAASLSMASATPTAAPIHDNGHVLAPGNPMVSSVTAANFPVTPLVGDGQEAVARALRPKQYKCRHAGMPLAPPDTRTGFEFASQCRATLAKNGIEASNFNFVEKPLHVQQPGVPYGTPSVVWMGNPWCYRQDLKIKGSKANCSPLFEVDWVWDALLHAFPGCRKRDLIADENTILQNGVYVQGAGLEKMKGISRVLQLCDSKALLIHLGDEWMHNIDGPWKDNQAHGHVPKDSYKGDSLHESWEKGFYHSPSFPIIVRQYWNKDLQSKFKNKVVVVPLGYSQSFYGLGWHPENEKSPGADRLARLPSGAPVTAPDTAEAERVDLIRTHQIKPALSRKYPWAFIGNANKSTRAVMMKAMNTIPGGYFYGAMGFHGKMLMPEDVRPLLGDAQFCPSPTGWTNPDSFRFSEAMEAGCFPLVDTWAKQQDKEVKFRTYWEEFLAYQAQFVDGMTADKVLNRFVFMVDDWKDAPALIAKLKANPTDLADRHRELVAFWSLWKDSISLRVKCAFCQRVSPDACMASGIVSRFLAPLINASISGARNVSEGQPACTGYKGCSGCTKDHTCGWCGASKSCRSKQSDRSAACSASWKESNMFTDVDVCLAPPLFQSKKGGNVTHPGRQPATVEIDLRPDDGHEEMEMEMAGIGPFNHSSGVGHDKGNASTATAAARYAIVRPYAKKSWKHMFSALADTNELQPCTSRSETLDLIILHAGKDVYEHEVTELHAVMNTSPLRHCFRSIKLASLALSGGQVDDKHRSCEMFHAAMFPWVVNNNVGGATSRAINGSAHTHTKEDKYDAIFYMDTDVLALRANWVDFVAKTFEQKQLRPSHQIVLAKNGLEAVTTGSSGDWIVLAKTSNGGPGGVTGFYAVGDSLFEKEMRSQYMTSLRCDQEQQQDGVLMGKHVSEIFEGSPELKKRISYLEYMAVGLDSSVYKNALTASPHAYFYHGPTDLYHDGVLEAEPKKGETKQPDPDKTKDDKKGDQKDGHEELKANLREAKAAEAILKADVHESSTEASLKADLREAKAALLTQSLKTELIETKLALAAAQQKVSEKKTEDKKPPEPHRGTMTR